MPRSKKENIVEGFDVEVINDEIVETKKNEIEYKEEICPILWIKEHAFAIDFQGYGLSFHVLDNHYIDIDKIKDLIPVKYESEIGKPDFKIYIIFE